MYHTHTKQHMPKNGQKNYEIGYPHHWFGFYPIHSKMGTILGKNKTWNNMYDYTDNYIISYPKLIIFMK